MFLSSWALEKPAALVLHDGFVHFLLCWSHSFLAYISFFTGRNFTGSTVLYRNRGTNAGKVHRKKTHSHSQLVTLTLGQDHLASLFDSQGTPFVSFFVQGPALL